MALNFMWSPSMGHLTQPEGEEGQETNFCVFYNTNKFTLCVCLLVCCLFCFWQIIQVLGLWIFNKFQNCELSSKYNQTAYAKSNTSWVICLMTFNGRIHVSSITLNQLLSTFHYLTVKLCWNRMCGWHELQAIISAAVCSTVPHICLHE